MKKLITALCLAALVSTTVLTSCKKYEDGPAFSLLTKKARLTGDWKIDNYTVNGDDQTDLLKGLFGENFVWSIKKDGTYKMGGNLNETGKWKFGEDKDDVTFTPDDSSQDPETDRILRLKSKELWLKHTESNGDVEILKLKR